MRDRTSARRGTLIVVMLATVLGAWVFVGVVHIASWSKDMISMLGGLWRDPSCDHVDMCYVADDGRCVLKHPVVTMPTEMRCDKDYSHKPEYAVRSIQQQSDGTYIATFKNYLCADGRVEKPQGPTCRPTDMVRVVDYVGHYGDPYYLSSEEEQRYVRLAVEAGYYYHAQDTDFVDPGDVWLSKGVVDELLDFAGYVYEDGRCGELVLTYGYRSHAIQEIIGDLRDPRGSAHQAGNTVDLVCTQGVVSDAISWMPGYYYLPQDMRSNKEEYSLTGVHGLPGERFGLYHLIDFDPPHYNIANIHPNREVIQGYLP